MRSRPVLRVVILILIVIGVLIAAVYLYPNPHVPFEELYADVGPQTVESLRAFRETYPPRQIEVDGVTWEYVALGQGEEAILFLHGMSGAYDIWWQVMEALQDRYRVISVTYPAVDTLEGLSRGVLAILDEEGVDRVTVVGSSLGGYLAQYLVATHPERIERAVFANTFPPNDLIIERTRTIGKLLPFLPEWLVMRTLRSSILNDVYPAASGNAELVRAYLLEQAYGAMSKAQFVARYRCVVEPFTPPDVEALGIPVLIIEASNDPLVEEALRDQLRETYPTATVYQLEGVGHFPYLNEPEKYLRGLEDFLPE